MPGTFDGIQSHWQTKMFRKKHQCESIHWTRQAARTTQKPTPVLAPPPPQKSNSTGNTAETAESHPIVDGKSLRQVAAYSPNQIYRVVPRFC